MHTQILQKQQHGQTDGCTDKDGLMTKT